jgi:hypothetical protein
LKTTKDAEPGRDILEQGQMFYGEIVKLNSQDAEAAKAVKNNSAIGQDNIPMVFPTIYMPFPKHVQINAQNLLHFGYRYMMIAAAGIVRVISDHPRRLQWCPDQDEG